jgi:hypothetical protein
MRLNRFKDSQAFFAHTQSFLLQHPSEHNLLLGILDALVNHPEVYSDSPYLVTVEAVESILAIAIRTPPYKLILSKAVDLAAVRLIAQDVYQMQDLRQPPNLHQRHGKFPVWVVWCQRRKYLWKNGDREPDKLAN